MAPSASSRWIKMTKAARIPPAAARKLGYYVYLYVNPLDGRVFYVGKGKANRALSHLRAPSDRKIAKAIKAIRAAGEEPRIEILAHGLPDEKAALRVEAAVIDASRLENLANRVRGWRGRRFGRTPWNEAVAHYTRRKARIREPAILIRINELYRPDMTAPELYDATRSGWVLGEQRKEANYAFAVFEGVIREVYRIEEWLPGGTSFAAQYGGKRRRWPGRWEFVGTLAEKRIRQRYINRYVGDAFPPGAQNPVKYVNVK
jgi:hypothetical protein